MSDNADHVASSTPPIEPSAQYDGTLRTGQRGAVGWGLLWLIGIPIPILIILFVMRGCT